jgi:hypothetical protein
VSTSPGTSQTATPSCTTPPPSPPPTPLTAQIAATIQQLTCSLQQLVALLQAQHGAAAISGGGATQSPVQQSPVQQSPVQQSPVQQTPTPFRIATFNVLGASHTAGGKQHPNWKAGAARVPALIRTLQRHDVSVAGLQEFEPSQRRAFRRANTGYALEGSGPNAIAYRTSEFTKVGESGVKVPYFGGHEVYMPAVQLEQKSTGKRMWVVNVHNPADTSDHPHQGRFRAEAIRRERAFIKQLRASGVPVFIVGDFNETTRPARALTTGGLMTSAAGSDAQAGIDQIYGTGGVQFARYQSDASTQRTKVSDHPIVTADATIA